MKPVISVVIPTYNRQSLTEKAISSVKCDHPQAVEIVVVDDFGSTPFEFAVVKSSNDIIVRVIRSSINGGPGVARSIGVTQAKGEIIAFLDSDDEYVDGWMNSVLLEAQRFSRNCSNGVFIVGEVIGASLAVRAAERIILIVPLKYRLFFVRILLMFSNAFHTPSIAVSKSACLFSDKLRYCEDYYTNVMAIFRVNSFIKLPVTSCVLSRRQGTIGGESVAKWRMFRGEMSVRLKLILLKDLPIIFRLLVPFGMVFQVIRDISLLHRRLKSSTVNGVKQKEE